jgi:hypothetical protein
MAHEVAGNGKVPTNFNSWEWQAAGLTVAHILVKKAKYLPHSFDQWGLISTDGFSVAHTAILFDNLPISFNQWAIEDSHGSALKSAVCRPIMKRCLLDLWATEKPLCKTEKDWTVFKAELPEVYVRYSVQAIIEDMEGSQSKQQLM